MGKNGRDGLPGTPGQKGKWEQQLVRGSANEMCKREIGCGEAYKREVLCECLSKNVFSNNCLPQF
jgi:hypothetical protein